MLIHPKGTSNESILTGESVDGGIFARDFKTGNLHPSNTFLPIDVTFWGIVNESKPLQSRKAFSAIVMTSSPSMISLIEANPLNHEPAVGHKIVAELRLLQPRKALSPIEVTPFPIVIEVKLLQS